MKKIFILSLTFLSCLGSIAQDITGIPASPGEASWYIFQCRNDSSIKSHAWVIVPGAGSFVDDSGNPITDCNSKLMGGDCSAVRIKWNADCGINQSAYLQVYTTKVSSPAVACNSQGTNPFLPSNIVENHYSNSFGQIDNAPCVTQDMSCPVTQKDIDDAFVALNVDFEFRSDAQVDLLANIWSPGDDFIRSLIRDGIISNEDIASGICNIIINTNSSDNCNLDNSAFCNYDACLSFNNIVNPVLNDSNLSVLEKVQELSFLEGDNRLNPLSQDNSTCALFLEIGRLEESNNSSSNTTAACPFQQEDIDNAFEAVKLPYMSRTDAQIDLLVSIWTFPGDDELRGDIRRNDVTSEQIANGICNIIINYNASNDCNLDNSAFCNFSCEGVSDFVNSTLNSDDSVVEKAQALIAREQEIIDCGIVLYLKDINVIHK